MRLPWLWVLRRITALFRESFCWRAKSSSLLPESSAALTSLGSCREIAFHLRAAAKGNTAVGICEEFQADFFIFCADPSKSGNTQDSCCLLNSPLELCAAAVGWDRAQRL